MGYYIPCLIWLRQYKWKSWLLWDLAAGLSVAAMVIPQGMSYANLAGLPQVYGLYGAFLPCLVYSLFGTSKQLVVGPVAVTSILLANGLENIFPGNPNSQDPNNPVDPALQDTYNRAAVQVAFIAGFFYTAIGVLRLGWVINFLLSAPTVSGFMSGASITIALSQVKYILGIKIPRSDQLVESLQLIFSNLQGFNWREFSMGMSFIFLLLALQFTAKKIKKLQWLKALGPLLVCIISIIVMNAGGYYKVPAAPPTAAPAPVPSVALANGTLVPGPAPAPPKPPSAPIKSIGKIPKGLPDFTGGWWLPLVDPGRQLVLAALICLIDICESISIAKALAQKNKYELNYTQELRGLGYANIVGALFNCYTTTGSFSRSAVNNNVGAKSPLSMFTSSMTIMLVLLVLTGVFTNMSQNVQGAIIIVGVLALFDYPEFFHLWKINKLDWCVWVITFLFTVFLGVEVGIGVGVGVSLLVVLFRSAFPTVSTLGRIPETRTFRAKALYPGVTTEPGILVVKPESRIVFASVDPIRAKIVAQIKDNIANNDVPKFLVMDLVAVSDIDATGVAWLRNFVPDLQKDYGLTILIANPNRSLLVSLKRADLIDVIGEKNIHVNLRSAVAWAHQLIDEQAAAKGSPPVEKDQDVATELSTAV